MDRTVAVIGLGIMGSRMAGRLLAAGWRVRGCDPDPERAESLRAAGGEIASTPAAAVDGCELALLSLPTSAVSREVCLGAGGLAAAGGGSLLVMDATTGAPEDAVDIAAGLARHGVAYLETTVSGNAPVAEAGRLVVMVGGEAADYRRAIPILEVIGRSHHHVGPHGAGSRLKLVVNHVLAVNRLALAEGLVVAERAGLELGRVLEVLRDSAAFSRAMDMWGERMVAGDHFPASARVRQSHKDARLILEHARNLDVPVPLMEVAQAAIAEAESTGLADHDNSAVAEVMRRRAGLGRIHPEETT